MGSPKTGPQRVTSKAQQPFASPLQKLSLTHTPVAETQTRHRSLRNRKLWRLQCGWRPLALCGESAGAQTSSKAMPRGPALPFPQRPGRPHVSGQLDPDTETKMDNDHRQGAQTRPHHGPQRAGSSPVRLLVTGLGLQPTPAWAEPAAPCRPCPAGSRAGLSGAHWRSLWRDFGSEKLCMREGQGAGPVPRGQRTALLPGGGNWLVLRLLQPSGWHKAGGAAWACLAAGGLRTPLATGNQPKACP